MRGEKPRSASCFQRAAVRDGPRSTLLATVGHIASPQEFGVIAVCIGSVAELIGAGRQPSIFHPIRDQNVQLQT